jgi:hypothetical protein
MTAITSWAPRRRSAAGVAAGLACVLVAALLGWLGGRAVTSPVPAPASGSRTVRLGPVEVVVPGTWAAVQPSRTGVTGLPPRGTLAFAITSGLPAYALVTLATPADRRLIPSSLLRTLRESPGVPSSVMLAGHRAWAYRSVATLRGSQAMDVVVVPTSAGILSVACVGPRSVLIATAGCENDVERISLAAGRALTPTRALGFRLQVGAALVGLQRARTRGDRALRAAPTRSAQARAMTDMGNAYAAVAAGLTPFVPVGGSRAGLVAALREGARAYRAAAAAARAGAPRAYGAERAAVSAAEARFAGIVGR